MKKITIILLLLIAATLSAVNTAFYEDNSIQDFEKGRLDGVSVNEKGELYLAPAMKQILGDRELFIWKLARDASGNIYAATGNSGRIYRIDSTGKSTTLYNDNKSSITALAAASDGKLYAALSPGGTVISITDGTNKSAHVKLPVSYVWDLLQTRNGDLYAVTGNPARLYRISAPGKAQLVFEAKTENHLLCLGMDKSGNIYTGSEGNGRLYKIFPDGRSKVLYDSYEDEIAALLVQPSGEVIFGTATPKLLRTPQNFNFKDTFPFNEQENRTAAAAAASGKSDQKQKKPTRFLKNSVYKLTHDEKIVKLATFDKTSVHSLAAGPDNAVYVGTGDLGVIYKIAADGALSRLIRLQHDRVLDMLVTADGFYAATGNDGAVFYLDFKNPLRGKYISRVFDCQSRVTWGSLRWTGSAPTGTAVSFETRSGDSDSPDDSWSTWESARAVNGNQQIVSPRARYIQYRISLQADKPGKTPVVQSITLPFLRQNRAPVVRRLTVLDHKDAAKSKKLKLSQGESVLQWYAYDEDDDTLTYALYFRFADDPVWRLLKDGLTGNTLKINNKLFPDGAYYFRVIASDLPSNSRKNALSGAKDSTKQLFDSSAPIFSNLRVIVTDDTVTVTGDTSDALSVIRKIKFTVNAVNWYNVTPEDGVYDSRKEQFRIVLNRKECSELFDGKNMLLIRAFDFEGNFSMVRVYFDVKLRPGDAGTMNNTRYFKLHYRGE